MHFSKVAEGDFADLYTIQDASGNYLYAAAADKNQLKGAASINADYAADNTLNLPMHQSISDDELQYIIEKVKEFD